ncbi:MAG TPA: hypothetical protein VFS05_12200 [Gemmatimonadaceae bacterium]|nr:hypothetical protein [Gemmatimonadaceae bacterium]
MALTLDRLREEGDAFMQEVSRELYRAQAGHQGSAELQPIYARHAGLLGDDALALARESFLGAPEGSEERRGARYILEWLVEARAEREVAPLQEREIAWESAATLSLEDGRRIPYQRAAIELANARDRADRLAIERARAALVDAELAPLRRERFERERDAILSLDIAPDYRATFTALSGIDLPGLVEECRAFLRDTGAMWDDVVRERVRATLGIPPGEATRADALALLRAPEFDAAFPAASMQGAVRRQLAEMQVDPDAGGRIIYDTAEREGKRSRAFCAPVRVPEEVYLVMRPHGGQSDWRALLHEAGHALHFANVRPDFPFEYRWIGDNSVTEAYAMLFDHRLQSSGWLRRYTELPKAEVPRWLRAAGFEELHFLRRYCAKLIYEHVLYGGELSWDELPDVYVQTLTGATTFRYDRADAFVDVDPRFYAARYLRAWQLQALLDETLTERFDEDWWRNPRAGPWVVRELFAEGQREQGHELAQRVAGRPLSFAPLVRSVERLLAA